MVATKASNGGLNWWTQKGADLECLSVVLVALCQRTDRLFVCLTADCKRILTITVQDLCEKNKICCFDHDRVHYDSISHG